jgi:phosphate butyryltransferase
LALVIAALETPVFAASLARRFLSRACEACLALVIAALETLVFAASLARRLLSRACEACLALLALRTASAAQARRRTGAARPMPGADGLRTITARVVDGLYRLASLLLFLTKSVSLLFPKSVPFSAFSALKTSCRRPKPRPPTPEERQKRFARLAAHWAVVFGIIPRKTRCEHCNRRARKKRPLHKHHVDYSRPLDVTWLCASCHGREHARLNGYEGQAMPRLRPRRAKLARCAKRPKRPKRPIRRVSCRRRVPQNTAGFAWPCHTASAAVAAASPPVPRPSRRASFIPRSAFCILHWFGILHWLRRAVGQRLLRRAGGNGMLCRNVRQSRLRPQASPSPMAISCQGRGEIEEGPAVPSAYAHLPPLPPLERVSDLTTLAGNLRPKTVIVPGGEREDDLRLVESARDHGIVDRIVLAGDAAAIRRAADAVGIAVPDADILGTASQEETAAVTVAEVRKGAADIILKGNISTPILNRAILAIRTRPTISLVTLFDAAPIAGGRPMLLTDPGVTTVCNFDRMVGLVENAVEVAHAIMGLERPRVAILSANEKVIESLPSTVMGKELSARSWDGAVVYGPLSFDLAVSEESVRLKGAISDPAAREVAGRADVLVCPGLDSANILYKIIMEIVKYGLGTFAGITVGVQVPYVILSRSDNVETKLQSIALCSIAAERMGQNRQGDA